MITYAETPELLPFCKSLCWPISLSGPSLYFWLSMLWLFSEIVIRIVAKINGAPRVSYRIDTLDAGSGWMFVIASLLMAAVSFIVLFTQVKPTLPWVFLPIGVILMLLGMALRIWAVATLGQFFTMRVTILTNHHLVRRGPYQLLQHPSYAGVMITAMGFGLASGYPLIFFVYFFALGISFAYRIYVEERVLRSQFGKEWEAYSSSTWRLIPWIW